jgi:sugar phosphate permease
MKQGNRAYKRILSIVLLIISGEAVFVLPFVLARVFRPTYLAVFDLTNTELGNCFMIYGIVALVSYLFGGPIADKVRPNILMSVALFLTAIGGLYASSYPSFLMLKILYGYWGFTTIFLFWSAMIKATRIWGGTGKQGKAFGFLDGGRGLTAALFGSFGVIIFSFFIQTDIASAETVEKKEAFQFVLIGASAMIILIGLLVLFFLKSDNQSETNKTQSVFNSVYKNFIQVFKIPSVWLLSVIIVCAYFSYKVTDIFSLYAKDVMQFDEINAAKTGNFLLYIRPVTGVLIGILADRSKASIYLVIGFILTIFGSAIFASGIIDAQFEILFFLSILITALGTYAARVLYFAAMEEGHIPVAITGTAVGILSVTGYTPDIFAGPLMGYFLDTYPGEKGHQLVFLTLSVFSLLGLVCSVVFLKINNKN